MKRLMIWVPLLLFAALFLAFAVKLLNPGSRDVRSAMVGKPVPAFALPVAFATGQQMTNRDLVTGRPRLLNIFASWCVPCVAEIPVLLRMKELGVEIDGVAVHDTPDALRRFLDDNGNPYGRIGLDANSRLQIAMGSAGVPESFVIDGRGIILYQHIGPITPEDAPRIIAMMQMDGAK